MSDGTAFFGTWRLANGSGLRGSLTFEITFAGEDGKGTFALSDLAGSMRCAYAKSAAGTSLVHFELAEPEDGPAIGSGYGSISKGGLLEGQIELGSEPTPFSARRLRGPLDPVEVPLDDEPAQKPPPRKPRKKRSTKATDTDNEAAVTQRALEALLGEPARIAVTVFGVLDPPKVVADEETETLLHDEARGVLLCNPDWLRSLVTRLRDDAEVRAIVLLSLVAGALSRSLADVGTEDGTALRAMGAVPAKIGCPRAVFERALPVLADGSFERARLVQEGYDAGAPAPKPARRKRKK